MSYLKFKADQLFTGHEMLDGSRVLITDKEGVVKDIVAETEAGPDVQYFAGILTPGFINCHCHLELSHMKGLIAEKTGLVDFVFKVVTQRHFSDDEMLHAIALGEEEMLNNGIVAVGDICNNVLTLPQKILGRLTYHNFIEASGWLPSVANNRFIRSSSILHQFDDKLPNNSMVPHAPYSVSNELWKQLRPFFAGQTVSIHNQETMDEDEFFRLGTGGFIRMYQLMKIANEHFEPAGTSSVHSYYQQLREASNVILVHNTYSNSEDIAWANQQSQLNQQHLWWSLCPNANLYIEDKLPPVTQLMAEKSSLVIGTDSLAGNWQLSVLSEIKTLAENFTKISLTELLKWATLNGAKALGFDKALGSFDTNKQPGVLVVTKDLTEVTRLI